MDLSYSDEPREGGGILIRGRLKHLPGGHYEDSFMPAPLDTTGGKSDVQAVGSTNSFLRRYVACNIFNIVVVGDDDDGTGGTIDETQTKTILELIKKAKVGPKFLKYMKAQSVEEAGSLEAAVATIAARDYRKAISTLEEQIAKAEASHADLYMTWRNTRKCMTASSWGSRPARTSTRSLHPKESRRDSGGNTPAC